MGFHVAKEIIDVKMAVSQDHDGGEELQAEAG
jgi:hypothetical protein